ESDQDEVDDGAEHLADAEPVVDHLAPVAIGHHPTRHQRLDDLLDDGVDDLGESTAVDHCQRQVDDVAAGDELFELLDEAAHGPIHIRVSTAVVEGNMPALKVPADA